jgi:hypothetical protein
MTAVDVKGSLLDRDRGSLDNSNLRRLPSAHAAIPDHLVKCGGSKVEVYPVRPKSWH